MLNRVQIKSLPVGEFPNHKLFGPNNFLPNKQDIKKPIPIYYNRRQIRTMKYSNPLGRAIKGQEIFLPKVAKEDIDSGHLKSLDDIYDSNGKIKSKYIKTVFHKREYQLTTKERVSKRVNKR